MILVLQRLDHSTTLLRFGNELPETADVFMYERRHHTNNTKLKPDIYIMSIENRAYTSGNV